MTPPASANAARTIDVPPRRRDSHTRPPATPRLSMFHPDAATHTRRPLQRHVLSTFHPDAATHTRRPLQRHVLSTLHPDAATHTRRTPWTRPRPPSPGGASPPPPCQGVLLSQFLSGSSSNHQNHPPSHEAQSTKLEAPVYASNSLPRTCPPV